LTGIIYFGEYHFTCRFIDIQGTIWYNDGMETGRQCTRQGHIDKINLSDLKTCKGKDMVTLFYSQ
ncbi:hypothetical protein OE88DRAFT_1600936, partial [Heliocybe sulcata]